MPRYGYRLRPGCGMTLLSTQASLCDDDNDNCDSKAQKIFLSPLSCNPKESREPPHALGASLNIPITSNPQGSNPNTLTAVSIAPKP